MKLWAIHPLNFFWVLVTVVEAPHSTPLNYTLHVMRCFNLSLSSSKQTLHAISAFFLHVFLFILFPKSKRWLFNRWVYADMEGTIARYSVRGGWAWKQRELLQHSSTHTPLAAAPHPRTDQSWSASSQILDVTTGMPRAVPLQPTPTHPPFSHSRTPPGWLMDTR